MLSYTAAIDFLRPGLFAREYRRIFQLCLDSLLSVFMILQPLTGILMSKHLYTFLPAFPISSQARSIHMAEAYWGYVLLCVHSGSHLCAPLRKLHRKSRKAFAAVCLFLGCVSVYGCRAWVRRDFPGYMTGQIGFAFFDYDEARLFFLIDYIAIMILFMGAGALIMDGLGRLEKRMAKKDRERDEN